MIYCPECGTAFDPVALLRIQLDQPATKRWGSYSIIGSVFASIVVVWVTFEFGPPGLLTLVVLFAVGLSFKTRRARSAGPANDLRRTIIDKTALLLISLAIIVAFLLAAIWWLFKEVFPIKLSPWL